MNINFKSLYLYCLPKLLKIIMNLQELKQKSPSELISQAEKLGVETPSTLRKQEILFSILKKLADGTDFIYYIILIIFSKNKL